MTDSWEHLPHYTDRGVNTLLAQHTWDRPPAIWSLELAHAWPNTPVVEIPATDNRQCQRGKPPQEAKI